VNNGKSWNWRIVEFDAWESGYRTRMFQSMDKYFHYVGHCRAKGCHVLAQCFVVFDLFIGRRPCVITARKVMCRAHAETAVAKRAT
jgi:hypothetical protein